MRMSICMEKIRKDRVWDMSKMRKLEMRSNEINIHDMA